MLRDVFTYICLHHMLRLYIYIYSFPNQWHPFSLVDNLSNNICNENCWKIGAIWGEDMWNITTLFTTEVVSLFFPFEIRTNDQKPDPNFRFRKQHPSAGSKVYAVMLGETFRKSGCQRHLPGHARASGMPPGVGVVSYEASKRKIYRFLGRGEWMRSTEDEQFSVVGLKTCPSFALLGICTSTLQTSYLKLFCPCFKAVVVLTRCDKKCSIRPTFFLRWDISEDFKKTTSTFVGLWCKPLNLRTDHDYSDNTCRKRGM